MQTTCTSVVVLDGGVKPQIVKSSGLEHRLGHPRITIDIPLGNTYTLQMDRTNDLISVPCLFNNSHLDALDAVAVEDGCFGFSLDRHILSSYIPYKV